MANVSKRSAKKEQAILDSLRDWPSVTVACAAVGISRPTLRRWRRADPEFDAACDAAQADGIDVIEDAMVSRAVNHGDTTAAIFLLKSWRRQKYGDRQTLEHTGPGGQPLTIVIGQRADGPQ